MDLPPALARAIARQAQDALPGECCGLIEGVRAGAVITVTALHPAHNMADAPDRFEIHPQDHVAAQKAARAAGLTLVGCYHSHPSGAARPSPADALGAGEKDFVWVIAAPEGREWKLAAFAYDGAGLFADLVISSE